MTTTLMPTPPRDPRALQFRPVVGSQPCSAVTPDLPSEPQSTETTIPPSGQPQLYEALDGQLCYGLGPSAADGTDLTGAKAAKGPNGWTIEVEAKPASAAKLNALFDDCYRGTDLCPASEGGHGFVAVVIDSKVASAPSIQATGLASKPFQISGSFSRAEAMALAALLNS